MELRYDGPGHVLKAFGETLKRGESATFTKAEARLLLDSERIHVTELPPADAGDTGDTSEPEAHEGEGQATANDCQEE